MGLAKDSSASGGELEVPASPPAAARLGIAQTRSHEALAFEPAQREVHRRSQDRTPQVTIQFIDNWHAVRLWSQPHEDDEDALFEIAQRFIGHVDFIY
jgi:hypothetical protein